MRVLFDHQIFSYQTFGGASRYFVELMSELARTGKPAFDLGVAASPNEYLAYAPYYRGTRVQPRGAWGFLRTYARNELATRAAALRQRHDILHPTFYDPAARLGRRGARLVVTVLDMIPEHFPQFFDVTSPYGRFVTQRWIEGKRTLCEHADRILAISENTKRDVVRFYNIPPDRIAVTHLGNRLTRGGVRPAGFPPRYLLFVGTRNKYKNFDCFVTGVAPVLARTPGLGVVCVGGGAFSAAERVLLARYRIADRFTQQRVADDELAACYSHAEAFVFPSRYEGFGIPILEAFACGCPTLLANASCFPEIAGDAAAFFDPDDPDNLAAVLDRVLDDDALRADLVRRGAERQREFTWARTAERTIEAYREAVRS